MYRMRLWSVRNARWLNSVYAGVEWALVQVDWLLRWIGHDRLEKPFIAIEKISKGFLLESRNCGQCIVGSTGMSCPMNCPKSLRNGPCGGVRPDGKCEIDPDMICVWVLAWEGNKRMVSSEYPIQLVQPPVDYRLIGRSAWLHAIRLKTEAAASSPRADGEF